MDLTALAAEVAATIANADVGVVAVGGGTHQEVGNRLPSGLTGIRLPAGIVAHEPDDLTVTALAGTTVRELQAVLAASGQEVPLDPRDADATVGGVLAAGLSGTRRLRLGPVRDTLLEVRFVDGTGTLVTGGGPVVKNVSGYDIPRLLVGSLGTLGVMLQVTLRCRPIAAGRAWFTTSTAADEVRAALFRPSSVLTDGVSTHVLLEGVASDIAAETERAALGEPTAPPFLPAGAHRGRISVPPAKVAPLVSALRRIDGLRLLAEAGVGTVHVAGDTAGVLVSARSVASAHKGWLLREAGGPEGFDGFGVALPNRGLAGRVKRAFDPHHRLSPGRIPL
mgnify:CR=1 FL=1